MECDLTKKKNPDLNQSVGLPASNHGNMWFRLIGMIIRYQRIRYSIYWTLLTEYGVNKKNM